MRRIAYWLSLVLIFTLPWEGAVQLPGIGTGTKAFGVFVAVVWIVAVASSGRVRRPTPFLVTMAIFVLWVVLSVSWSTDVAESLPQAASWLLLLGLAFMLWDLYRTRRAVLAGLQAYVLGAYIAVGSAIFNFLSGTPYYAHYDRYAAGETNPDGFAFLIALAVPPAWYLATFTKQDERTPVARVVNLAFIPMAFVGLALSGTRTAAIAAVLGTAFGIAAMTRLRPSVRVGVVLLLTAAVVVLLPIVQPLRSFERFGTTGTELTEGDWNGRLAQWGQGLASVAEHPFLGVGVNMYRSVNTLGKVAHNSFISVIVELGVVGLLLFQAALVIAIVNAVAHPTWERRFWLTVLAVWVIGASTLTWEDRKTTWLFLTLIVASAATRGLGPAQRRASPDLSDHAAPTEPARIAAGSTRTGRTQPRRSA